jgi:predicted dehydrogenase
MKNKSLKVGVVGCGYWGPNLIRNFNALSDCDVKLICDTDVDRLSHLKSLYPVVDTTTSFDQLAQDSEIDAVAVATPVRHHFKMAKQCLLAGKHVFIEKPMASSVAECRELISLAAERNLTLMVGHTFIYTTVVKKIKEIIDKEELGDILYISSRRLNLGLFQQDINVTWDLAPHDISIVLYLMDKLPLSVNCQGKAHIAPGIEDVTNLSLNYGNGGFASIQSSWLDPNKVREMTIVGSKRMLLYNDLEPLEKIKIYDKHVETPPHYDTFAEFHCSYHYGDMYSPYIKQVEPLKEECQHFLDCISTGDKPITSGLEGLQVVQILEAASQSLQKEGNRVKIHSLESIPAAAVKKLA